MATANTGAAADVATPESTEPHAANTGADATDARPLTGESAPDENGPESPTSLEALLARGRPEDLDAAALMLESGQVPEETGGEAEADAHTDEQAETETGDEDTTEDAEADEVEETPKAKAKRLRMEIHEFDADGQKLLLAARKIVSERPGTDFRTALEEAGMEFTAKSADAATQQDAAPVPTPDVSLAAVEAKLDDLEKQFDEADAAFDIEAKKTLRRQIRAAEQELAEARAETRVAASQLQAKVAEHTALVAEVIPDMARDGTPLAKAAASLFSQMKAESPAFFKNPEWPKKFAALVWLDVNPDKPMPALVKGRAQASAVTRANGNPPVAEKPRVPVKQGRSVAMLSGGNAGQDLGGLAAKVQSGRATIDELDQYAMALEGRR